MESISDAPVKDSALATVIPGVIDSGNPISRENPKRVGINVRVECSFQQFLN